MTFGPHDLRALDRQLLSRAAQVMTMRDVRTMPLDANVIGLRHDVDRDLDTALRMARWEHEQGYRSTYFLLHTAGYWHDSDGDLGDRLKMLDALGHEIGLHLDSITEALGTGGDPWEIAAAAAERLRRLSPSPVIGVVGHGDPRCHRVGYVNDEIFSECARPDYGPPDRTLRWETVALRLEPRPLADLGFEYCSIWLPRVLYVSDSGGSWAPPLLFLGQQTHVLQHPCWWFDAFV